MVICQVCKEDRCSGGRITCSETVKLFWVEKIGNVCEECLKKGTDLLKEKPEDKPYEIMVVTSDHSWGKAPTLIEAMKNASVGIATKKVMGYVGKDLSVSGMGAVMGSEIIDLGDLAVRGLFDRADLIEAVQAILEDLGGHDRLGCTLEEIKERIWAEDEEAEEKRVAEEKAEEPKEPKLDHVAKYTEFGKPEAEEKKGEDNVERTD